MIKLKNSEKAIKRLILALKNGEKIGIWSDYDPDGVFALVLAYEGLISAGFDKKNMHLILPNQYKYERSFNKFHLTVLKKMGIKLIVGIDFGTTDFKQATMAKKMGFEIIFLDHHRQRPGKLPALLINPWQTGDQSKCKNWSGAGVVYLFLENLYKTLNLDLKTLEKSIDLILIPFVTDYIDRDGGINNGNLPYLRKSLAHIKNQPRPGIEYPLKNLKIYNRISLNNLIKNRQRVVDFFGVLNGNGNQNNVFKMLISRDPKEAGRIARNIHKHQMAFTKFTDKTAKKIINQFKDQKNKYIFWGTKKPIKLAGARSKITSKINDYFKVPVYFYDPEKDIVKGSVRASYSKKVNVVDSMKGCADSFINFGGHPKAAGFDMKKKKIPTLKKCLDKYYEEH